MLFYPDPSVHLILDKLAAPHIFTDPAWRTTLSKDLYKIHTLLEKDPNAIIERELYRLSYKDEIYNVTLANHFLP
jgi:hypothetical protein